MNLRIPSGYQKIGVRTQKLETRAWIEAIYLRGSPKRQNEGSETDKGEKPVQRALSASDLCGQLGLSAGGDVLRIQPEHISKKKEAKGLLHRFSSPTG